jgi:hypothetical protein
MIDRLMEAERLIMELRARLGALEQRVSEVSQSTGKVWGAVGSAGSGGAGAFYCPSIPAIAGGASGTGNVYTGIGGSGVLVVTGATIYNVYASATTSGRVCTLCQNTDGTYQVYGQSCI